MSITFQDWHNWTNDEGIPTYTLDWSSPEAMKHYPPRVLAECLRQAVLERAQAVYTSGWDVVETMPNEIVYEIKQNQPTFGHPPNGLNPVEFARELAEYLLESLAPLFLDFRDEPTWHGSRTEKSTWEQWNGGWNSRSAPVIGESFWTEQKLSDYLGFDVTKLKQIPPHQLNFGLFGYRIKQVIDQLKWCAMKEKDPERNDETGKLNFSNMRGFSMVFPEKKAEWYAFGYDYMYGMDGWETRISGTGIKKKEKAVGLSEFGVSPDSPPESSKWPREDSNDPWGVWSNLVAEVVTAVHWGSLFGLQLPGRQYGTASWQLGWKDFFRDQYGFLISDDTEYKWYEYLEEEQGWSIEDVYKDSWKWPDYVDNELATERPRFDSFNSYLEQRYGITFDDIRRYLEPLIVDVWQNKVDTVHRLNDGLSWLGWPSYHPPELWEGQAGTEVAVSDDYTMEGNVDWRLGEWRGDIDYSDSEEYYRGRYTHKIRSRMRLWSYVQWMVHGMEKVGLELYAYPPVVLEGVEMPTDTFTEYKTEVYHTLYDIDDRTFDARWNEPSFPDPIGTNNTRRIALETPIENYYMDAMMMKKIEEVSVKNKDGTKKEIFSLQPPLEVDDVRKPAEEGEETPEKGLIPRGGSYWFSGESYVDFEAFIHTPLVVAKFDVPGGFTFIEN